MTQTHKINKIVNVTLTGGITGLLAGNPADSLNEIIRKENNMGWNVVQVIPAASGNIFLIILRLVILFFTLFLYTTVDGYYIVLEKEEITKPKEEEIISVNDPNKTERDTGDGWKCQQCGTLNTSFICKKCGTLK